MNKYYPLFTIIAQKLYLCWFFMNFVGLYKQSANYLYIFTITFKPLNKYVNKKAQYIFTYYA